MLGGKKKKGRTARVVVVVFYNGYAGCELLEAMSKERDDWTHARGCHPSQLSHFSSCLTCVVFKTPQGALREVAQGAFSTTW